MTHPYRLKLQFAGIDFLDDDTFEALAQLPTVQWLEQNGVAHADAVQIAPDALTAVQIVIATVRYYVPSARPIVYDRDLVSVSDIADRAGVSRETARLWSEGKRGPGNFPRPAGSVGDRIRVWEWAPVNDWLQQHYKLGDVERYPNRREAAEIDLLLIRMSQADWSVHSEVKTSVVLPMMRCSLTMESLRSFSFRQSVVDYTPSRSQEAVDADFVLVSRA
ncbi:MAG: helix-turn-helix transcriptional regulator [Acidimicrobiia bacterium]